MSFEFKWLHGDLSDPIEESTFAALKIFLNDQILTRAYDRLAGGERDAINVALYPLALFIAKNWWALLNEPRKSDDVDFMAEARHSLDSNMTGFVFPPMSIWSAGHDTVEIEIQSNVQNFSNLKFFPFSAPTIFQDRGELEIGLFELVSAVVKRLTNSEAANELHERWNSVLNSLSDADERQYCIAAGKLGLDPYDPDSIDLTQLSEGLTQRLFSDVCESSKSEEIVEASQWAREGSKFLADSPKVDITALGAAKSRSPDVKIWDHGYETARLLRTSLSLDGAPPRRVVDSIFGDAVTRKLPTLGGPHPYSIQGVTDRIDGEMRVVVPNVSARVRRSTLCRSLYIAWRTNNGDCAAITTAGTSDQQASRAFAAELLAPVAQLREIAGSTGLTEDDIETVAEQNVCPEAMVIWHAYNHDIPLRGVSLPVPRSH